MWAIAWPVALSFVCRIGMSVTDLAFLGHLSTDSLASAAMALIWMNVSSNFVYAALGTATSTLCAQAFGSGNRRQVGRWMQLGLLASLVFALPIMVLWWFTEALFVLVGIEEAVARLAGRYARISAMWVLPSAINTVLQAYFQAQGDVVPALGVNMLAVGINAGLNQLLIFGLGSWDGLGFDGSPLATTISRTLSTTAYFLLMFPLLKRHLPTWPGWTRSAFDRERLREFFLRQALPNGLSALFEEAQLELVAGFAAHIGKTQVATNASVLELFFFLTSAMFGGLQATSARVAFFLGKGEPRGARLVAKISLAAAFVIGAVIGSTIVLLRKEVGHLFSDDPAVWRLAEHLCILVGSAYFLLAFFYSSMGVLDGQARPMVTVIAFVDGGWGVSVPMAYVLAFTLGHGLLGLWYGLVLGYGIITIIVSAAVYFSNWHELAVKAIKRSAPVEGEEDEQPFAAEQVRNVVAHPAGMDGDEEPTAYKALPDEAHDERPAAETRRASIQE